MGDNDKAIRLYAVGDIVAFHKDPESAFEHVGSILQEADITFAQNERHYNNRVDLVPRGGFTELTSPENAEALKLGGFDVISFASNHTMDLGPDIMLETLNVLRKLGFAVIGAGKNISEVRKPAIIERKGTKVGFLAYTSVLRNGDVAGPHRAGCAPMRAWTLYHQIDYQAGTPPRILTFPYKEDLEAVIDDIKRTKAQVDVLAVSFHWGVHFYHAVIADYQREVAHAVIDAGADIILGHHPHQLKGIEVYKGKPIFYSMGNFALDLRYETVSTWKDTTPEFAFLLDHYDWRPDPEWAIYPFPPESRKSMIVKCEILGKQIQRVCFLPVLINQKAQPQIVPKGDRNFNELFHYVKGITESQGLDTRYTIEGNEIVVGLT